MKRFNTSLCLVVLSGAATLQCSAGVYFGGDSDVYLRLTAVRTELGGDPIPLPPLLSSEATHTRLAYDAHSSGNAGAGGGTEGSTGAGGALGLKWARAHSNISGSAHPDGSSDANGSHRARLSFSNLEENPYFLEITWDYSARAYAGGEDDSGTQRHARGKGMVKFLKDGADLRDPVGLEFFYPPGGDDHKGGTYTRTFVIGSGESMSFAGIAIAEGDCAIVAPAPGSLALVAAGALVCLRRGRRGSRIDR